MDSETNLSVTELREAWPLLDAGERVDGYRLLESEDAEGFFEELSTQDQLELLRALPEAQRRMRLRLLAPDDITDLLQQAVPEDRAKLVDLLEPPMRREVVALLAYAEDDAGGLMSPRFARVRPEMTVDEAILYLRRQAYERLETIYYAYVLDREQRLLGVASFRDLF